MTGLFDYGDHVWCQHSIKWSLHTLKVEVRLRACAGGSYRYLRREIVHVFWYVLGMVS